MNLPINIVLADDDKDDHFLFAKALGEISSLINLTAIGDGEKLMCFLSENIKHLPDVVFLDLNMPRKKGSDCLTEIKQNRKLKQLPIVIYSTSFHEDILDLLYKYGASYCIRKPTDPMRLKETLHAVLIGIIENRGVQPLRENFLLDLVEA